MALHLIKLCVGASDVDDLRAWIAYRGRIAGNGARAEHIHTTRMFPKRANEIIAKGSLYWVIKGQVQCRQPILDLRRIVDDEGKSMCEIVMAPELHLTRLQPKRPFQGWRYLTTADAPDDIVEGGDGAEAMPDAMRQELSALGLL